MHHFGISRKMSFQTVADKIESTVRTAQNTTRNTINRTTGNHTAVITNTTENIVAQAGGAINNVLGGGSPSVNDPGGVTSLIIMAFYMNIPKQSAYCLQTPSTFTQIIINVLCICYLLFHQWIEEFLYNNYSIEELITVVDEMATNSPQELMELELVCSMKNQCHLSGIIVSRICYVIFK